MSNPDSSTPSIQARNLAVKPAGYDSWDKFIRLHNTSSNTVQIALAYAADLDKADKVGRLVEEIGEVIWNPPVPFSPAAALLEAAKPLRLPDPIDPDLLEAREIARKCREDHGCIETAILAAVKRGRELAKE